MSNNQEPLKLATQMLHELEENIRLSRENQRMRERLALEREIFVGGMRDLKSLLIEAKTEIHASRNYELLGRIDAALKEYKT